MKRVLEQGACCYPMVLIRWKDSHGDGSWIPFGEWPDPNNYIVSTVGVLLEETDNHYRVAQSINYARLKNNWICIPKISVISVDILRKYNMRKKVNKKEK